MGGGGWDAVGRPLSLGVYSVVREGAGAAAGCISARPEFNHRSCVTYMVLEGVEMCW